MVCGGPDRGPRPQGKLGPLELAARSRALTTVLPQRRDMTRRAIWLSPHDFTPKARIGAQREGGALCRPDCVRRDRRAGRSDPPAGAALQPRVRPARGSLLPARLFGTTAARVKCGELLVPVSARVARRNVHWNSTDRRIECQPSNHGPRKSTWCATTRVPREQRDAFCVRTRRNRLICRCP
jgi:hypothetical protein